MNAFLRGGRSFVSAVFLVVALGGCGGNGSPGTQAGSAPAETTGSIEIADWCAGHGVPESKCTICNPELIPKFKSAGDWCAEHGLPESVCPQCRGGTLREAGETDALIVPGMRIRFRSPELEQAAGIRVALAREAGMASGVACTARIDFNRDRVADIRAPFAGLVREVRVDLGAQVETGDPLFVLESPEVSDLQGRIRAARQRVEVARADFERHATLSESGLVSSRDLDLSRQEFETAQGELAAAEAATGMAGTTESAVEGAGGRYTIRAPIQGVVARRPAMIGTFADGETSLATVADLRLMWAVLEIPELDVARVRVGQKVTVDVEGLADREFSGVVTWIAAEVDPVTRTVAARAGLPNSGGALRAEQFARAMIETSTRDDVVAVPAESVQRIGVESVVFVRVGEGLYEPRSVRPLRRGGGLVQVSGAIRVGEAVVTDGAFLLRTELSRESIGAGCCEIEPVAGR